MTDHLHQGSPRRSAQDLATPGGTTFSASGPQAPAPAAPIRKRMRLWAGLSSVVFVAAALPHLAVSVFTVLLALQLSVGSDSTVTSGMTAWTILCVWIALGLLMLFPPVARFAIRVLFRLRRPTRDEMHRAGPAWAAVAKRADVPEGRHSLLISSSSEQGAHCSAGTVIVVTGHSLRTLPGIQIEALVAHELGHTIGAQNAVRLIMLWYTIPASIAIFLTLALITISAKALRSIYWFVVTVLSAIRLPEPLPFLPGILAYPFFLYFAFSFWIFVVGPVGIWLLPLLAMALTTAWLARAAEKRADRVAAGLGYGSILMDLLSRTPEKAGEDPPSWWDTIIGPHLPAPKRLHALGKFMSSRSL